MTFIERMGSTLRFNARSGLKPLPPPVILRLPIDALHGIPEQLAGRR